MQKIQHKLKQCQRPLAALTLCLAWSYALAQESAPVPKTSVAPLAIATPNGPATIAQINMGPFASAFWAKLQALIASREITNFALEEALGRPMSLSSVYTLLHRHDWRKLAPDKRHPQGDPVAQDG